MTQASVLFDFIASRPDGVALRGALLRPQRVLQAFTLDQVGPVLDQAHQAARDGAWCVGFVRYEAAPAFDAAYVVPGEAVPPGEPLVWFAIQDELDAWPEPASAGVASDYVAGPWRDALDAADFEHGMARISAAIAAGENYQINYTTRLQGAFSGNARACFEALHRSQPNSYAACIDTGQEQILSVSPELFFDWRDGQLLSRPMKGTAARGSTPASDAAQAAHLRSNAKERAENLMIVDLIRNDLSRVALPHTVAVPALFETRAWPTVWQMTSDVTARSRPGTRLSDVFAALFPCGSVVGVPKVRAMQLIRMLEPTARAIYCGAVGVLQPGGAATFNVAIRTVRIDPARQSACCGIGSGITSDAVVEAERQEWRNKRLFLERASQPFQILETLLLEQGQCPLLSQHLQRMGAAAAWFGYPWGPPQRQRATALLQQQAEQQPYGTWRLRLLLEASGALSVQAVAQPALTQPLRVELAARPLTGADGNEFVRFKTTRRAHYDVLAPRSAQVFDALLWNERQELTEFTRGNLMLRLDGEWLTPALSSGLLDGIGRRQVLQHGVPAQAGPEWAGQPVREAVLTLDDLTRLQALAFVNSCRGWHEAHLQMPLPPRVPQ